MTPVREDWVWQWTSVGDRDLDGLYRVPKG